MRLQLSEPVKNRRPVSIHASVRMRRASSHDSEGHAFVSIHASVRMRQQVRIDIIYTEAVSIHASVRMRPPAAFRCWSLPECFNPRIREDATPCSSSVPCMSSVSIHASVRMRHRSSGDRLLTCDVSIHASVRMRRECMNVPFPILVSFNPRIREDATAR